MSNIKVQREKAILNKQLNYSEGIMTRKEYLDLWHSKGGKVEEINVRQWKKEEKEKEELKGLSFRIPFGNEEHPQTKEYNKRKKDLEKGFYKTEYILHMTETRSIYITKIEFEYFNSL